MVRFIKRYQLPIAVLLAVILPLLVYRANALEPSETNILDRMILTATQPVRKLMGGFTEFVSERWYRYVALVDARKDNAELRQRLRRVERERDLLKTLAIENRHLYALLEISENNPELELLPARVIGAGISPTSRTLELDVGSISGVESGDPVVSADGLVGRIQRISWNTSEVLLIADEQISVRAMVVRTRARGRLMGQGLWPAFRLRLTEVLRADDVKPGDRIITSGLAGLYPAGLPIGLVTEAYAEPGAQHRVAEVEPYIDFARLERVAVVKNFGQDAPVVTPEPLRPPTLRTKTATETTVGALE